MENFRTAASRPSNLKRAEWKRKCREQVSAHIYGRLGVMIDPSQVRLKTHPDDAYTWERMEEKEHLFLKNISDHSTGALKELCDGIRKSFAATGNRATRELQAGSVQETYLYTSRPELSFTAKIDELQEGQTTLAHELHQWKVQAASESGRRRQAEEEVNRLHLTIQAAQEHQQKLEREVKEWKVVAEQSNRSTTKYCQGVGKILALIGELKPEPPVHAEDFSEVPPVAEQGATGPMSLVK